MPTEKNFGTAPMVEVKMTQEWGAITLLMETLLIFGKSDSPNDGDKSEDTRGREDMWILKINQNGTVLWDKRYGGNVEDSCSNAIALPDGDFFSSGLPDLLLEEINLKNRYGGDEDIWVIRIDASGNKLWDKKIRRKWGRDFG